MKGSQGKQTAEMEYSRQRDKGIEQVYEARIPVPGQDVRRISKTKVIEKTLLAILAFCCERARISKSPSTDIQYDAQGNPVVRHERYGTQTYGLFLRAEPIRSGIGVHGETGTWTFHGLPAGIRMSAESRLDMRGGRGNFYAVRIWGDNLRLSRCIAFARRVLAGESIDG